MKLGLEEKLIALRQERDRYETECQRLARAVAEERERLQWFAAFEGCGCKSNDDTARAIMEILRPLWPDGPSDPQDFEAAVSSKIEQAHCCHPADLQHVRAGALRCSDCGAAASLVGAMSRLLEAQTDEHYVVGCEFTGTQTIDEGGTPQAAFCEARRPEIGDTVEVCIIVEGGTLLEGNGLVSAITSNAVLAEIPDGRNVTCFDDAVRGFRFWRWPETPRRPEIGDQVEVRRREESGVLSILSRRARVTAVHSDGSLTVEDGMHYHCYPETADSRPGVFTWRWPEPEEMEPAFADCTPPGVGCGDAREAAGGGVHRCGYVLGHGGTHHRCTCALTWTIRPTGAG